MKTLHTSPAAQLAHDVAALADSALALAMVAPLAALAAVVLVKLAAIIFE